MKGFFGKIRKWLADLKALAFKSTVATNDIDNTAVTDAKISSVSASKVTGLHNVATSGDYNDLINKPNISGGGTDFGATFIVDSNDKLSQWIRADSGNDYSVVLIKKGTWQSDELLYDVTLSGSKKYYAGVNLSKTKTKVVIGEVGSKIN